MTPKKKFSLLAEQPQYNILIVDDEPHIVGIVTEALTSFLEAEVKISPAGSCKEALGFFEKSEFDLAIVDYKLPDGDGVELIRELKSQDEDLPVVMITGHGDLIKDAALEAGANVFLDKPVELMELLILAKNLLSLSKTRKSLVSAENMIVALNRAIETRDSYTEGHSSRVARYSLKMFDVACKFDAESRRALHVGCLLHDIGKIGVPDHILKSKKHPLDMEDYDIVKQHPGKGYEICKDLEGLKLALPIIKFHHEKLDGTGYPDGITVIPLIVQIVTVADIYDALVSERSYRRSKDRADALSIIREEVKAGKLNKDLFEALEQTT